jgi:hypothetical protein
MVLGPNVNHSILPIHLTKRWADYSVEGPRKKLRVFCWAGEKYYAIVEVSRIGSG